MPQQIDPIGPHAYKVLDSTWRSTPTLLHMLRNWLDPALLFVFQDVQIGIVAVETFRDPENEARWEWKAYVGVASGRHLKNDEQHIAAWGSGLALTEADGFFPQLPLEHYKKEG